MLVGFGLVPPHFGLYSQESNALLSQLHFSRHFGSLELLDSGLERADHSFEVALEFVRVFLLFDDLGVEVMLSDDVAGSPEVGGLGPVRQLPSEQDPGS